MFEEGIKICLKDWRALKADDVYLHLKPFSNIPEVRVSFRMVNKTEINIIINIVVCSWTLNFFDNSTILLVHNNRSLWERSNMSILQICRPSIYSLRVGCANPHLWLSSKSNNRSRIQQSFPCPWQNASLFERCYIFVICQTFAPRPQIAVSFCTKTEQESVFVGSHRFSGYMQMYVTLW